jgi:1-acyl-sn-glycerol-3-phosphate acyltransferase
VLRLADAAGSDGRRSTVTAVVPPALPAPRDRHLPPTGPRRRPAGRHRPGPSLLALRVEGTEHVPADGPVHPGRQPQRDPGRAAGVLRQPRPCRLLTKAEVFVGPWARPCGWLGLIPVHRGQADRAALQAGLAELAAGGALGVFPEGTRGTGALEQVADGVAYLALRSGAPVVPIAVTGTRAALPRGKVVPVLRTPVRVVFGAPVTVEPTGDPRARRTVRDAAEQLRLALVAHCSRRPVRPPAVPRSSHDRRPVLRSGLRRGRRPHAPAGAGGGRPAERREVDAGQPHPGPPGGRRRGRPRA